MFVDWNKNALTIFTLKLDDEKNKDKITND